MEEESIDRWGVNGEKGGRKGWESLGLLRGFSLNETRCVVGPVRGGIG